MRHISHQQDVFADEDYTPSEVTDVSCPDSQAAGTSTSGQGGASTSKEDGDTVSRKDGGGSTSRQDGASISFI